MEDRVSRITDSSSPSDESEITMTSFFPTFSFLLGPELVDAWAPDRVIRALDISLRRDVEVD